MEKLAHVVPAMSGPVEIISWRSGRQGFGSWHLSLEGWHGDPICGARIPDKAVRCTASHASGPLLLEDICTSCLKVYAERGTVAQGDGDDGSAA